MKVEVDIDDGVARLGEVAEVADLQRPTVAERVTDGCVLASAKLYSISVETKVCEV